MIDIKTESNDWYKNLSNFDLYKNWNLTLERKMDPEQ